eukprot:CAMPEP_0198728406 /NCGR_PEP_ID=MMETSP1475-20131203/9115_1 /TAXON_ID= ORGANISM="Unidentified sp., Strain CCMP1999" /NCGR_SAMPLE_ID=MMETSP1475 /ASSEMBLY_ACC=CAM_ASM_001111 /LENGTH=143 /DNA_ID=CAMNT_0044490761 /DNA_START=222 /DNA_END=653 /DNA_ORIENTATION=-
MVAFVSGVRVGGGAAKVGSANGSFVSGVRGEQYVAARSVTKSKGRTVTPMMGVFGLGVPELLVIGGAAALIFGPSKISELGKSLGGVAGSVKKASNEFQEAMQESMAEADKEIAARKEQVAFDKARPVQEDKDKEKKPEETKA